MSDAEVSYAEINLRVQCVTKGGVTSLVVEERDSITPAMAVTMAAHPTKSEFTQIVGGICTAARGGISALSARINNPAASKIIDALRGIT